jgi:hypothetical protein
MGLLYKNRTLVGNISLVVFLTFLATFTFGALPRTAAAVTPTEDSSLVTHVDLADPAAVKDKDGNWVKDGGTAKLVTNAAGDTVDITVQVLTPDSFDNIVLEILGIGNLDPSGITSAVYKVYGEVSGTVYYVYQFVYHWVYSAGLNTGAAADYTLNIYSNSNMLASITLDLEAPPPQGGGGGGGGTPSPYPATTDTVETNTGTVTTAGDTSTLKVDPAKIDVLLADPEVKQVELAVPAAAGVDNAEVLVAVEQLAEISAAGKDVVVSFGGVELTFAPGTLDLAPFAGQNATVKFEISRVDESRFSGAAGAALKIAGAVYEINVRVLADGVDKGGIHSFNKPVTVELPYDPAGLAGSSEDRLGVYRYNEAAGAWDYVGGKVDKANKSVTVALSSFSKYAVMAYEKTFADLAGHWSRADVELMAARHIARGITDTTFGPDLNITRAQFAAFIQRALNLAEDRNAAGRFADVQEGDWFAGAVAAAAKAGLVKGYEDGAFRPGQLITRQEMAVMVTRALAFGGKAAALSPAEVAAVLAGFSDADEIGDWARDAAALAVKESIVQGRAEDLYVPASNATRAEGVVMLKRLLAAIGVL